MAFEIDLSFLEYRCELRPPICGNVVALRKRGAGLVNWQREKGLDTLEHSTPHFLTAHLM